MASYATAQDMLARFGERELIELTDREGEQGAIVTEVLDTALVSASALIDGYLAGRYQLPLANALPVLTDMCCHMARFNLYDDQVSDTVAARNKDTLRFLEKVANGQITLGIDAQGESATSTDLAQIESAGSMFSRQNSGGFI